MSAVTMPTKWFNSTTQPPPTTPPVAGGVEPKPGTPPATPGAAALPWATNSAPWVNRANAEGWFRTRGGHELYGLFRQIYDRNEMAGRAFWDSVVGRGRGENDLQAATIHKMFGGNMDDYNNWRNKLHHQGQESYLGNFDLSTGKWTNGGGLGGFNDFDWSSVGVGAWNPNYLQTGLQSKQGIDPATGKPYYYSGADSWKTYGAGQYFDPTRGASYAPPALQAQFAAGQVPGYNTNGTMINPPANNTPASPADAASSMQNTRVDDAAYNPGKVWWPLR